MKAADYLGWVKANPRECDVLIDVEGQIPKDLNGVLYRNGPAVFERGGVNKPCYVDGDGMVHGFWFNQGRLNYRNRFVRTKKWVEESKLKKFLYDTWTFKAPVDEFDSLQKPKYESQAFISAVYHHGKLFTFDESFTPYELDPETLETISPTNLGVSDSGVSFAAHSKVHTFQNQWIHFGLKHDKNPLVYFTIFDGAGKCLNSFCEKLPRAVYVHDFFATENYIVMSLHPAFSNMKSVLSGRQSFLESLDWRSGEGNLIAVYHKSGCNKPIYLEADTRWWLHAVNAWETSDEELVLSFVGHDSPDHILGENPMYKRVLTGNAKGPYAPGRVRQYRIDLKARIIKDDIVLDGNYEFPTLHPDRVGCESQFAFMVKGSVDKPFWNTLAQVNLATGSSQEYCFGESIYCSEPIIAPKYRGIGFGKKETEGYVMSLVYDGKNNKYSIAILKGGYIEDGPISLINIENEIPLTFHGCWREFRNEN